ncbi:MAG TPA: sensor histidine kinase [Opitutaceae bacterium]|jgi:sensor histidine kinase YesM|nr:sensor histidine kinase [Opitutaceae bacterium]
MAPTLLKGTGWVALWSLVALAIASEIYLSSNFLGRSITWGEAISDSLEDWYVYGALSLAVVWLARRYPPERGSRWAAAGIHLVAALAFSFAYVLLRTLVGEVDSRIAGEPASFGEIFHPLFVRTIPFNLLVYGVILSMSHALDYYRKYHDRTVQTLELEKHLTEARLQALLHQLKPHFLFNTLNGIASLMHTDVDAADKMLVRLSELLRITMSHTGAPKTSLREEVAFIERYLDIEKIRFRNRLEVSIAVDQDAIEAQVPSLILQPMVENAMHHGVEPNSRMGRIEVRGARKDGNLVLSISDNGAGIPEGGFKRQGIGVANTRARLTELYGSEQKFEMANGPKGGLCVTITIPYSVSPS